MLKIYAREEAQATILQRRPIDELAETEAMRQRTIKTFGEYIPPDEVVRRILGDVRVRGDAALIDWTQRIDGAALTAEQLLVSDEDIAAAYDHVDAEVVAALERAAERIRAFHTRMPAQSWMETELGGVMGQLIRPLQRVGIYIPGGSAPLASTLLMTAIPARMAGVDEIVICSPPSNRQSSIVNRQLGLPHPIILVAADIAAVDLVFNVGGAQAIGGMAFGTNTLPRVDKICGPGNLYVVLAKKQVFGVVGIDALPGPTETVIVADAGAHPAWLAADLLAQAEHSGGTAILMTPVRALAEQVGIEIDKQIVSLATAPEIRASLAQRSGAVITEDVLEAVTLADDFAPEHLCLSVREPWAWVHKIRNAGGVFVGEQSYEVLGDYCAGPSHVMPTGATARFTPPCNVLDFVRVMNVIALDENTARAIGPVAAKLAQAEGLPAHENAVRRRLAVSSEQSANR
jgi:histidinol dehydrogenase